MGGRRFSLHFLGVPHFWWGSPSPPSDPQTPLGPPRTPPPGFQLRRTLLFVSWDGGEFGHLGATEWLEVTATPSDDPVVASVASVTPPMTPAAPPGLPRPPPHQSRRLYQPGPGSAGCAPTPPTACILGGRGCFRPSPTLLTPLTSPLPHPGAERFVVRTSPTLVNLIESALEQVGEGRGQGWGKSGLWGRGRPPNHPRHPPPPKKRWRAQTRPGKASWSS